MGTKGQDWASYQGNHPSATNLDFVFIKVTEGAGYVNPYWKAQYADAKAAGAAVGKYHYPHMGNSVINEAATFIHNANIQPGDMIVLDWEGYDPSNQNVSKQHQLEFKDAWVKYVKGLFPHNPVGIYCNKDYWLNVDTTSFCGDFLWIATAGLPAGKPGIQHEWKFHQYTDSPLDTDYGNFASKAELVAWINSFNPVEEDMTPAESALLKQAAADAATAKTELAALNTTVTNLEKAVGSFNLADVLAQIDKSVNAAIAKDAVTATVEVNGKVV